MSAGASKACQQLVKLRAESLALPLIAKCPSVKSQKTLGHFSEGEREKCPFHAPPQKKCPFHVALPLSPSALLAADMLY